MIKLVADTLDTYDVYSVMVDDILNFLFDFFRENDFKISKVFHMKNEKFFSKITFSNTRICFCRQSILVMLVSCLMDYSIKMW